MSQSDTEAGNEKVLLYQETRSWGEGSRMSSGQIGEETVFFKRRSHSPRVSKMRCQINCRGPTGLQCSSLGLETPPAVTWCSAPSTEGISKHLDFTFLWLTPNHSLSPRPFWQTLLVIGLFLTSCCSGPCLLDWQQHALELLNH